MSELSEYKYSEVFDFKNWEEKNVFLFRDLILHCLNK